MAVASGGIAGRFELIRGNIPAFVGSLALVGGLGASQGGYFPTTWGWAGLGLGWALMVALVLDDRARLRPLELATVAGWSALPAWVALSILWTRSVTASVLEVERDLIYPLGVAAALLIVRRRSVAALLGGVLAAITLVSGYALLTRLLPDRIGGSNTFGAYRLETPIGYWNALGIFAAVGIVLGLGLVARARTYPARALAGAALPVRVCDAVLHLQPRRLARARCCARDPSRA